MVYCCLLYTSIFLVFFFIASNSSCFFTDESAVTVSGSAFLRTVSFLQILAPELNDRLLADFLVMESLLIVSMHIQSVDQVKAIKTVKQKITDLDRSKIEEQKKAVRAGYDMDLIPSDLATYGSEAKKLLQDYSTPRILLRLILNSSSPPPEIGRAHV